MQARIDTLLTLKDHIAGYNALLKGDFDSEIAQLQALKKEVDAKSALVDTVKKLEAQKKQADDYFTAKFDEAEKLKADAEAFKQSLAQKEAALKAAEDLLDQAKADHAKKLADAQLALANQSKSLDNREALVAKKEEVTSNMEKQLQAKAVVLAQQEAELAKKVAAIKQLAG